MTKKELLLLVEQKLQLIYKSEYQNEFLENMNSLVEKWESAKWQQPSPLSEQNVYLITYGDSIYENGKPTLQTLHKFLRNHVGDVITDVHLLPMFPYTSDDGFSVTDYRQINPELGDWNDIRDLAQHYRLMFDFVANHISQASEWFQAYLQDHPKYREYFIQQDPEFDTSKVVRPRTSPLFHAYEGRQGRKTAWTTFSEDQVDLNFRHFPVLLEMTDILLSYAFQGGTSIRLDAIGFLWKESATTSMHLPQAHAVIQLWRLLLDYFKPGTQIITETNVPHQENISYFGNGTNEAHMVYQFSLPPLVLFTLSTHNSSKLTEWAKSIGKVGDQSTYFNFLASHDGIGMRPTEGILTDSEKQLLVDKVQENGGRVSYKTNNDGTKSVYELNINYSDALVNKDEDITEAQQVQKMLAAHAILLSFIGVPAIYYHSLLGSRNDYEGLAQSGINRRINREKLEYSQLADELQNNSRRRAIFSRLAHMIRIRQRNSAFSPFASQSVLNLGPSLFGLERSNAQTGETVYLILNVDSSPVETELKLTGTDLLSGKLIKDKVALEPYEFVWLRA